MLKYLLLQGYRTEINWIFSSIIESILKDTNKSLDVNVFYVLSYSRKHAPDERIFVLNVTFIPNRWYKSYIQHWLFKMHYLKCYSLVSTCNLPLFYLEVICNFKPVIQILRTTLIILSFGYLTNWVWAYLEESYRWLKPDPSLLGLQIN